MLYALLLNPKIKIKSRFETLEPPSFSVSVLCAVRLSICLPVAPSLALVGFSLLLCLFLFMAGFPLHPDDRELWLPSGTFFNQVPSSRLTLSPPHPLDELAQHFAALSLLKQQRNLSKLPLKLSPSVQVTLFHSLCLFSPVSFWYDLCMLVFTRIFLC